MRMLTLFFGITLLNIAFASVVSKDTYDYDESISILVKVNLSHAKNFSLSSNYNPEVFNNPCNNVTQHSMECLQLNDTYLGTGYVAHKRHFWRIAKLVKKLVTIISQSLSILFLLIILFIFSSSRSLRNLHGKMLISVCFALLLSQFIFLAASFFVAPFQTTTKDTNRMSRLQLLSEIVSPCYILAFAMHYFYLAFYFWTNVMAYDFFRIFAATTVVTLGEPREQVRRFLKYSLYAWATPCLFIIALVIAQFSMRRLKYGFRLCFISESLDKLIYFVAPVAIILVINAFFILATVLAQRSTDRCNMQMEIRRRSSTNHDAKTYQSLSEAKDTRKRFRLFVGLYIVTGIAWLAGLVNSYSDDIFSWYIYILLNSFQGLFIFYTFTLNAQARTAFKNSPIGRTLFQTENDSVG